MATISPTSSLAGNVTTAAKNSMSSLGINDFITLMTTQLKYQDPTQPQDSTQFIAQLAQFSSVSGIQEMNTSMGSLVDQLRNSQALNATALVGHAVLVDAASMNIAAGQQVGGVVNTPDYTTNLNLVITDASGQVVRQMTVPAGSGESAFTWDGRDNSGNTVPAGQYDFEAIGNVAGRSTSLGTSLLAQVASVTINSDNSLQLNTDSVGAVAMSDVKRVYQ